MIEIQSIGDGFIKHLVNDIADGRNTAAQGSRCSSKLQCSLPRAGSGLHRIL